MMLGKMEIRTPPGGRPRDGRHCDLCGCSQPAVRCDKCGCQIFCLSCDDMYHRHPKRRFHLRKAVDPAPTMQQSRPVLPMKVAHLNATNPGDPSKMPLPPPRKKKTSLFGSFRRPSPSSDNSPPLPRKEYSWTDRLGSIKKFMSNRPLPPLPNPDDMDGELQQPTTNGQSNARGDLTFIHKKSDERPPQLPARSPRPTDSPGFTQEPRIPSSPGHMTEQIRNGSVEQNANHMNQNQLQNREFPGEVNQWNNRTQNQNGHPPFGTMNRQNPGGFMPPGGPGYPGGMHQSSSSTDLQNLHNPEGMPGTGPPHPHFPHYPMNPHMPPPHYPYPMYPQYPNYPQYFGNSFANLSNPPTTDGDFSDQSSEVPARHSSKKHPFRKRAKRSQSVMVDKMAYPGQFFPFGPYPGYGPWGGQMPMEAPPSPASSIRSLNRAGRSRRKKKTTSEDDDEELSMSSSPMSRPKSSSSDRPTDRKDVPRAAPLATQTTSSEDESDEDVNRRRNRVNTIQRRQPEPIRTPSSPAADRKRPPKLKKRNSSKQSDSEPQDVPSVQTERRTSRDSNTDQPVQQHQQPSSSTSVPSSTWECHHCTFVNPISNRICQVCCKTVTPRTVTPVTTGSRPSSRAETSNSRKLSVESEKSCASPGKLQQQQQQKQQQQHQQQQYEQEEDNNTKKEKQDMAILNSALDEAEKEISRGLEELMKLKDDIDSNISKDKSTPTSNEAKTEIGDSSKPVYKSTGRMRTSILDKLTVNNKPQASKTSSSTTTATTSTSTEIQTGNSSDWASSDKIIEPRRLSNSSTTSDAYNSPLAQSPELGNSFSKQKRDSSCQTQVDNLAEYLEQKRAAEESFIGRPVNNFGFGGYGDRMEMVTSPVPAMYDRFFGGGGMGGGGMGGGGMGGMMQRSHSRASLFAGRMNDLGPMDYGGPGFGYGPTPMYRSMSRGSLTGDYPDARMSEFHNLRKPDFYLSMEELVERRRQDSIRAQGLELVRMIREAEQQGFTADDIQVALTHCGKQSPMEWLQDNWRNMLDSVVTLSTNYGNDKKENDIGVVSESEARDSLRLHKGNIWAAVTECVEGRQRKYLELSARGNFSRKDIVDALTSGEGDVEMAYAKLSKTTGKPFLMRIWGAGEGVQNQDGAQPVLDDLKNVPQRYQKDEFGSDDLSDDLWSEDGGGVEWGEEDYEEERGDFEDLQTCHEDLQAYPEDLQAYPEDLQEYHEEFDIDPLEMRTPESDRSDYCDAFALEDRAMSSPSDDIFFVIPEVKEEKKKGFLSKLAALRKDSKGQIDTLSATEDVRDQSPPSYRDSLSLSSTEPAKGSGAFSALKNTFSAIKDTVTGNSKADKKAPCSQLESRTFIVRGQIEHEPLDSNVIAKLTSIKPVKQDSVDHTLQNEHVVQSSASNIEGFIIDDQKDDVNKVISQQTNLVNSVQGTGAKSRTENKRSQSLAERLKFAKQAYSSRTNLSSIETRNDNSMPSTSTFNASLLDGIPFHGDKYDDRNKQEVLTSVKLSKDSTPENCIKAEKLEDFSLKSSNSSKLDNILNTHTEHFSYAQHGDATTSATPVIDHLPAKDESNSTVIQTFPEAAQMSLTKYQCKSDSNLEVRTTDVVAKEQTANEFEKCENVNVKNKTLEQSKVTQNTSKSKIVAAINSESISQPVESLESFKSAKTQNLVEIIPSNDAISEAIPSDISVRNSAPSERRTEQLPAASSSTVENYVIKNVNGTFNESLDKNMGNELLKEGSIKVNFEVKAENLKTKSSEEAINISFQKTLAQTAELKPNITSNSGGISTETTQVAAEHEKFRVNNLDKEENAIMSVDFKINKLHETASENIDKGKCKNQTERSETSMQRDDSSLLLGNEQVRLQSAEMQSSQTKEVVIKTKDMLSESQEMQTTTMGIQSKDEEMQATTMGIQSKAKEMQTTTMGIQSKAEEMQTTTKAMQSKADEIQTSTKEMQSKTKEMQANTKDMQSKAEEKQTTTKEMHSKTKEMESLSGTSSSSNSPKLPDEIGKEISGTQPNKEKITDAKNEQDKSPEFVVSVSKNSAQNIEFNAAVDKSSEKLLQPTVSSTASEEKVLDLNAIHKQELYQAVVPQDNEGSSNKNIIESNATISEASNNDPLLPSGSESNSSIPEANKKDLLLPSTSEATKSVKPKTSKTGKLKKSQSQNKLKNLSTAESSIKSETTPETSVNTNLLVSSENHKEAGDISISASLQKEISSSKGEQEANDTTSAASLKSEVPLPTTATIKVEAKEVFNNQSTNEVQVENQTLTKSKTLLSEHVSKVGIKQAVEPSAEQELQSSNAKSNFQTKAHDSPELIQSTSTSEEPKMPLVLADLPTTHEASTSDKQETIAIPEINQILSKSKEISSTSAADITTENVSPEVSTEAAAGLKLPVRKSYTAPVSSSVKIASATDPLPSTSASLGTANLKTALNTIPESSEFPQSQEMNKMADTTSATFDPREQHSKITGAVTGSPSSAGSSVPSVDNSDTPDQSMSEKQSDDNSFRTAESDDTDILYSDESRPNSVTPPSPVDALRNRFEGLSGGLRGPVRPQSPFRRMSFNSRKQAIALERIRDTTADKPWFNQKIVEPVKVSVPKRTIKQQLEMERKVRKMVSDRKVRTYRKAEIVVQLMDLNFEEEEAIQASNECSSLEKAISYLQQECQLCAGHFPASRIVSMTHCEHRACCECIRAYFTVQIRDRTILDLLCPFCNEPDIGDEDVAQDYFNHLDIMLKKLVDFEIHELFQRKLRDRVLMKDPNFMWCSQCSSGFIAAPNLKRLVCPDCNAVTCASCRRLWERDHQGISCEAFAAMKDAAGLDTQAEGLAKMLQEDGIDCPRCHFRYALAKGGCMHFRCIQCQHDFCSGCSRPFKMGQKCGVSEFCAKLGLHAHHPRNCLFYLRDKEPVDLQKLLDMSDVKYNKDSPEGVDLKSTCQVMEQKETTDGMLDDFCGKEVQDGYAGLCRLHYVEYLGQLVNKNKVDPIQIFDNDDLELVLRRANIRLPPKRYRETDAQYREKLVNLIQEELPLDKMDGS